MTAIEVTIRHRDRVAQCQCGHEVQANDNDTYSISPHIVRAHELTGPLVFETVAQVVCPRMTVVLVKKKGAS